MHHWFKQLLCAVALASMTLSAALAAGFVVEGIALEDKMDVAGQTLVLNGAGFRKRGFLKTDVSAIYLPRKTSTMEDIQTMPGAKRIYLRILRDIPGSTISRYFINDFKLVTSQDEFKQLITEVGQVGALYAAVRQVYKGDVVTGDWIPGKGFLVSVNGRPIHAEGNPSPYVNNEMLYRILLRMYIGEGVPQELRNNLLGLDKSMVTASANSDR